LDLAFDVEDPDGFCPLDGGKLEFAGPLRGRRRLASRSPTNAASRRTSAVSAAFRAISAAINASLSTKSGGGVTHALTHIPRARASPNSPTESI